MRHTKSYLFLSLAEKEEVLSVAHRAAIVVFVFFIVDIVEVEIFLIVHLRFTFHSLCL